MCTQAPVNTQALVHTQALIHVCMHTPPLVPQPPHRLWPLLVTELTPVEALAHDGILRAAHGLEGRARDQGGSMGGRQDRFLGHRSFGAKPGVTPPSPPHLLQVPEEKVIVFIQKPWEGRAGVR